MKHYEGTLYDKNGTAMIYMTGIEDQPHWPAASWAEMAWNFMKQFARNSDGSLTILH
jgi:hypothetical protein